MVGNFLRSVGKRFGWGGSKAGSNDAAGPYANSKLARPDQLICQRNILCGWSRLSRGDVSIVLSAMESGSAAATMSGTPHNDLWCNLVGLGWAQKAAHQIDFPGIEVFELTDYGRIFWPQFIDVKQLLACVLADDRSYLRLSTDGTWSEWPEEEVSSNSGD